MWYDLHGFVLCLALPRILCRPHQTVCGVRGLCVVVLQVLRVRVMPVGPVWPVWLVGFFPSLSLFLPGS